MALGSHFIILTIWGFRENVECVFFTCVWVFILLGILLSRVSVLFASKTQDKTTITWSRADRGGEIGDFQHCIVITRGQEERIAETASVVGKMETRNSENKKKHDQHGRTKHKLRFWMPHKNTLVNQRKPREVQFRSNINLGDAWDLWLLMKNRKFFIVDQDKANFKNPSSLTRA